MIENSVNWLMLFTQPKIVVDPNVKLNLKAISQTKFEFFETFAVNFKRTIYDLITSCSSKSQEKNFINKYVFKIIEKCLIKLSNVEKEFLIKLNKISQNLIDLFLKTRNKKLQKLFRRCLRIVYIIYDRQGYSNAKIIKLFKNKFFPLLIFPSDLVTQKFINKILFDFLDVNFTILNKKLDLIDYYNFYYSLLLNEDPETKEKYISDELIKNYFESFLSCNEKLFKYEMSAKNQIYEVSYVKLLHNLFNTFYSDSVNENKKQISIEIICRILRNCPNEMKISILEEISFSHISFFIEDSNCFLLENVINSILQNIKSADIYKYFIKYMDILFIHALKGNYILIKFLDILNDLIEKIENEQIFYLTLSYCKKFFLSLQNEGRLVNINSEGETKMNQTKTGKFNSSKNISNHANGQMSVSGNNFNILNNNIIEVNGFLKILAITSHSVRYDLKDLNRLQEILDCYSLFLIIKIFNFPNMDFSFKFNLDSYTNQEVKDFAIYFLIFAKNLPPFVFNKNTHLTSPVKIEINFAIISLLEEKRRIISEEFNDFGDHSKKLIRELDTVSQLYLLGIYISFVAKYVFLRIFCNSNLIEKKMLQSKIDLEKIATTKISVIDMLDYFTDNLFLNEKNMHDLFEKIFEYYVTKYIDLLKNYHNTLFKQKLLSHDLRILLNYSCFYNENVRGKGLEIIFKYTQNYPFLLNEYDIFEYYVIILGILTSHSLSPYEFFIRRVNLNKYGHYEKDSTDILELPSEKYEKERIYLKLSHIFEQCLQKSHIINNNNISYNIANYVNKCSVYVLNSNLLECQELNYSINLLQKIYNNIKKVEISSFLKTTAYLDPKMFEDYLNENVYKNFDKYLTLSSIDDIYNFTDYAKSTILQIRNKYTGVIEGKIHNLRNNYNNDSLFRDYKSLFYYSKNNEEIVNNYCYYKIMKDINLKIQKIFKENDIKIINREIFPILLELTSFIVYADMNEFKTTFDKEIITDEIMNIITCIPIFLSNLSAIEAGYFCWEWILYLNKKKLTSLLNNIILSVKFMKQHKSYFIKIYNTDKKIGRYQTVKSEIFDVENTISEDFKDKKIQQFEETTLKELKNIVNFPASPRIIQTNPSLTRETLNNNGVVDKNNNNGFNVDNFHTFNYENIIYKSGHLSLVNMANERVLSGKEIDLNDLINAQINILKFVKECMNEICKCEIEKLVLIFNLLKLFVDLSIDHILYSQPLYIYYHFLIFNISIELIDILNGKIHLFSKELKTEDISEFKILLYLFGFRYFEFNKQRRIITDVVLLSEIEQTLINCVQMIIKDRDNKENYDRMKTKTSNIFRKKKKDLRRVYSFVYSIESKFKEIGNLSDGFVVYENIKDLLIYLIESEMNNMRYWNCPSTFHNNKKYTPSSSKFKADKVKNIFFTAFSISNKLSIKLVQRFPWIEKKFSSYIEQLSLTIYENRKLFYGQPNALRYMIEYISKNRLYEVEHLTNRHRKDFLMWKYPTLNYAMKYISSAFDRKFIMNRYAIMLLNNSNSSAIIFYMPQLIQSLKNDTNHMIEKFILSKCKESTKIAHQFLWSLEVEEISNYYFNYNSGSNCKAQIP